MNMLLIISKRSRSYTCVRTVYEENESHDFTFEFETHMDWQSR